MGMTLGFSNFAPMLCLLTLAVADEQHISNHLEHDELIINRKHSTNETRKETKREGDDMVLYCEYTAAVGSPTANRLPEAFEWRHNGVAIRETSPSSRVYTLEKSKPNGRTLTLIMRNLHSSSDSGLYECLISYEDVSYKRSLQITVMKKTFWEDTKEVISGPISQPLEINCVARGQPPPEVTIQVLDGLQADRDYVMIEKQKIQIQELKMEHRGLKIQCIATQTFDDIDDNQMTVKWITVDVTYPPVLDSKEQTVFGIKGESLTLPCVVKHSNPRVSKFEFSEISQGIFTEIVSGYGNYSIVVDEGAEAAYLQIPSLDERHFDIAFECKATANELSSSKKFSIKRRHPPALPFPSPAEPKDDRTIVWKLQDGSEQTESLSPVTKFRIRYLNSDQISNETEPSSLEGAPEWEERASEAEFDRENTDLYSINNLEKSATYYFRFQAVNKAGTSDWSPVFRMTTKTVVHSLINGVAGHRNMILMFLCFPLFARILLNV